MINEARKKIIEKVTKLEDGEMNLRESNIELIYLLTNSRFNSNSVKQKTYEALIPEKQSNICRQKKRTL